MGNRSPNAQTVAQQLVLRAAWEALPEVCAMSSDVLAQIVSEELTWSEDGLTRSFALVREWEAINGPLPDSGIRASG
jgi:hypothetical protein